MFSVSQFFRLFLPIPPTPTHAMLSLSLGAGVSWPPSTWRGTMANPAVAAAAPCRKLLRGTGPVVKESPFVWGLGWPGPFIDFAMGVL